MKKKLFLFLLVFICLFTITGCGSKSKKKTEMSEEERKEALIKDLDSKCDNASKAAYDLYKQNHTNKITNGVCAKESPEEYTVYFSTGEKLVYKYTYIVSDNNIKTPDNDNYNTEKLDEYAEKCEDYFVDGSIAATCTNHKFMLNEYQKFVNGIKDRPTVYKALDISKLK